METVVYVDVLLVLNYIINMLLLLGMCKLAGRAPKRRKIVAAALIGSAGSLTIFLPFMGLGMSVLIKLGLSSLIVLAACPFRGWRGFLHELFLFFAVSFCFAGAMLGIWMFLSPAGMFYHNGVVYFNISSASLVITTVAAYLLLTLLSRLSRAGKLHKPLYQMQIRLGERTATLTGLMDTGNSLYEPFSGSPVAVCSLHGLRELLPAELVKDLMAEETPAGGGGLHLRFIPYRNVGRDGVIPAFRPDEVILSGAGERWRVEDVYIGISRRAVGDGSYSAILNPDLLATQAR